MQKIADYLSMSLENIQLNEEVDIGYIKDALLETRENKRHASKLLGITRQGLNKKPGPEGPVLE